MNLLQKGAELIIGTRFLSRGGRMRFIANYVLCPLISNANLMVELLVETHGTFILMALIMRMDSGRGIALVL